MSKKKLDIQGITNELEGASAFFPSYKQKPAPSLPSSEIDTDFFTPQVSEKPNSVPFTKKLPNIPAVPHVKHVQEENRSVKLANKEVGKHASTLASTSASIDYKGQDPIEAIRKTVKQAGKEVIFVRVTPEEKHTLGSIVYSFNEIYRNEGRKTSENEVGRIGLTFLIEDYRANGDNSILARVLASLNA